MDYQQIIQLVFTFIHIVLHSLCQMRIENICKERDILKQVEDRLAQEKESILTAQRGQNLLLTNLKSIQVQFDYISQPTWPKHSSLSVNFLIMLQLLMERSETETKQRYNNQIQRLEKEIVQLKKKLEQEVEKRHALERNQDVSL